MERLVGEFDWVVISRTALALVLCGLVGLERSTHERASGLRPHILVGLGACLMTQAGAYGFSEIAAANRDPMRIASYVVSGIGFLGAGAILRHGTTVRGLTTAASLWGAAGIGIAVGAGMGGLAAVTVGLILFTLTPLQRLEARLRLGPATSGLVVHLSDDQRAVGKALAALGGLGVPVQRATMLPGVGTSAVLHVDLGRKLEPGQLSTVVEQMLGLKCVERVVTKDLREDDEERDTEDGSATAKRADHPVALKLNSPRALRDADDDDGDDPVVESQERIVPAEDRAGVRGSQQHSAPTRLQHVPRG
jgi:putative Mg2+ transporter-C (MgtC) family protein